MVVKVLSFQKPKTSGWSYRVKMPKAQFTGLESASSQFRPHCQPWTPAEWLRHPGVNLRGCWGLSWAGAWQAQQCPTHTLPVVASWTHIFQIWTSVDIRQTCMKKPLEFWNQCEATNYKTLSLKLPILVHEATTYISIPTHHLQSWPKHH